MAVTITGLRPGPGVHHAVGGEHLALVLLTIGEGIAHDVLVNLGVSYERLRAALTEANPADSE